MKDKLLIIRNQLKMGHRLSFAEAMLLQRAIDVFVCQAGNSPVIPDGYRLQPISEYEAICATVNSDEWPQRWIPVSERMPEGSGTYQVWNGKHVGAVPFLFGSFQCLNPEQVTHWMPTAKPPLEMKP
ncbi:TPA: DUF551 domain-containing protein [Raoultella ornithinolytica]